MTEVTCKSACWCAICLQRWCRQPHQGHHSEASSSFPKFQSLHFLSPGVQKTAASPLFSTVAGLSCVQQNSHSPFPSHRIFSDSSITQPHKLLNCIKTIVSSQIDFTGFNVNRLYLDQILIVAVESCWHWAGMSCKHQSEESTQIQLLHASSLFMHRLLFLCRPIGLLYSCGGSIG